MDGQGLVHKIIEAIIHGGSSSEIRFNHRTDISPYQGMTTIGHEIEHLYFNASMLLGSQVSDEEEDDLHYGEMVMAALTPLLAMTFYQQQATARDKEAALIRDTLQSENGYAKKFHTQYMELSEGVQWAIAYACVDKKSVPGEQLFQQLIRTVFVDATCYVRSLSNQEVGERMEWIIHIPHLSREQAEPYAQLIAYLFLPFYHLVDIVVEPPAIIGVEKSMRIGAMQIIDETLKRDSSLVVRGEST